MFTQSMTSEELAMEYCRDLPEIHERNERFDSSEFVTNTLAKKWGNNKIQSVYFDRIYVTKRNNKYLNVFVYKKQKSDGWKYAVFTVGLMQTFKGECAILFYEDSSVGVLVRSHFFSRYKERMLLDCDWKTKLQLNATKTLYDVISLYIRRNNDAALMKTDTKFGNKQHIFVPVKDGVALYQFDEKKEQIQCNTFVTNSMLSNQQKNMVKAADEYKTSVMEMQKFVQDFYKIINQK